MEEIMGISLGTILNIQTNGDNIKCHAEQNLDSKKWAGWICLYRNGYLHSELLSETVATHDSKEIAITAMDKVVQDVRDGKYNTPDPLMKFEMFPDSA